MFHSKNKEVISEVNSPSAGLPSSPSRNGARPPPASSASYHSQPSDGPPSATRPSYNQQTHSSQLSYHSGQQQGPHSGDRYAQQPPPRSGAQDRYGAHPPANPFGDGKSRNELLSGAPARAAPASHGEQQAGGESNEEVEGIKQQLRFVKQESLASTRNAVRIAREAEETGMATLERLGDQSGATLLLFSRRKWADSFGAQIVLRTPSTTSRLPTRTTLERRTTRRRSKLSTAPSSVPHSPGTRRPSATRRTRAFSSGTRTRRPSESTSVSSSTMRDSGSRRRRNVFTERRRTREWREGGRRRGVRRG